MQFRGRNERVRMRSTGRRIDELENKEKERKSEETEGMKWRQ